jgi:hypothetical protein
MKSVILILFLSALMSCSKESKTCTCKNWAKGGKIEQVQNNSNASDCNYYQQQFNAVYGSDVICELN